MNLLMKKTMIKHDFHDLAAYQIAFQLALEIYLLSKSFPKEEKYSLTDQIRRSSRSVCANVAEAYRKRRYIRHFISKLSDADGECSETIVWLEFGQSLKMVDEASFNLLSERYQQVGKLLGYMMSHPEKYGSI